MLAILNFENTIATLSGVDQEIHDAIRQKLSYEVKGAAYIQRTRPGFDGREYFLKNNGQFPSGLIGLVIGYLHLHSIPFKVQDNRVKPNGDAGLMFSSSLIPRPYQTEALEQSKIYPRGVFVMGTGAGKTLTSAMVIRNKNVETLFVTPNIDLKNQVTAEFENFFPDQIGNKITDKKPIIVTNIQQLAKTTPRMLERFKCLVIDEFHHSAAKTYLHLNMIAASAYYRYGFTGTFLRTDGRDLVMHGVLMGTIFTKTTSELIEKGYLVRPEIFLVRYKARKLHRSNYKRAYDGIIQDSDFNALVARITASCIGTDKQVLVLVRRIEHGEALSELIPEAVYLNGEMDSEYRDEMKAKFNRKEIPCLIATEIFGEGIDIPTVDCLINARLQKTEIQTRQGIGRVLRLSEGKTRATVFDFLIEGQKHLAEHSLERKSAYRSEPAFCIRVMQSPMAKTR